MLSSTQLLYCNIINNLLLIIKPLTNMKKVLRSFLKIHQGWV